MKYTQFVSHTFQILKPKEGRSPAPKQVLDALLKADPKLFYKKWDDKPASEVTKAAAQGWKHFKK